VNFPGSAPIDVTPAQLQQIFFDVNGPSLSDYCKEASYGKAWAAGDVLAPTCWTAVMSAANSNS